MANPWLEHVKETARKHKGMKFKDVLKHAKKTYKRGKSSKKHSSSKKTRRSRSRRRR